MNINSLDELKRHLPPAANPPAGYAEDLNRRMLAKVTSEKQGGKSTQTGNLRVYYLRVISIAATGLLAGTALWWMSRSPATNATGSENNNSSVLACADVNSCLLDLSQSDLITYVTDNIDDFAEDGHEDAVWEILNVSDTIVPAKSDQTKEAAAVSDAPQSSLDQELNKMSKDDIKALLMELGDDDDDEVFDI